jgi:hypothetical protein
VLNSQQHSEKEKEKRERKMNEYFLLLLLLQMCGVLVFLSHMHEWVEKGF